MDKNHSNYTGRTHRTLESAFGPYASGSQLHTECEPMSFGEKLVVVVCLVGLLAVVLMAVAGWLPGGGS